MVLRNTAKLIPEICNALPQHYDDDKTNPNGDPNSKGLGLRDEQTL
jgi:hypothetical protein